MGWKYDLFDSANPPINVSQVFLRKTAHIFREIFRSQILTGAVVTMQRMIQCLVYRSVLFASNAIFPAKWMAVGIMLNNLFRSRTTVRMY